jgi:hypothetical protein
MGNAMSRRRRLETLHSVPGGFRIDPVSTNEDIEHMTEVFKSRTEFFEQVHHNTAEIVDEKQELLIKVRIGFLFVAGYLVSRFWS